MPLGRKPDLSRVRRALLDYAARAQEHGDGQPGRQRGDYLHHEGDPVERLRHDLAKTVGHLMSALDALERGAGHLDPDSGLPHVAHAAARLSMALGRAVDDGVLPADPCQALSHD